MSNIRGKIYYDKSTGNVIVRLPEQRNTFNVRESTVDEDFKSIQILKERIRTTVGVIILELGQYAQEFSTATSYRVNPTTKKLEFSNAAPFEPSEPPVYEPPISERVEELEAMWLYDSMMKDMAIVESNATQADMMYQLMLKGVL